MQPPPQAQVVRRGTSKAVPIVVSAGLAVGVFCGLLFGLGTGPDTAVAEPSTGNNVKKDGKDKDMIMEGSKVTDPGTPKIDKPKPAQTAAGSGSAAPAAAGSGSATTTAAGSGDGSGSATTAASGSAAPAAGSGAGSATASAGAGSGSAAPMVKKAKLTVEITPEAAATAAKISIDKKEITGNTTEIELDKDKKQVVVSVKATGFKTPPDQKVDLVDGDVTVKIELQKRAAAPAGNGLPRPGGKKDGKSGKSGKSNGGGGLIDI